MNSRGSAYILIFVLVSSALLMLSVVSGITTYQAKISTSYKNHSNLSLLAQSGAEYAVYAINRQLEASRADISRLTAARMDDGGDYLILFAEEADKLIKAQFVNTEFAYDIIMGEGARYSVRVRIVDDGAGLALNSFAERQGSPGGETVIASIRCVAEAQVSVEQPGYSSFIIEGDISYKIEMLRHPR